MAVCTLDVTTRAELKAAVDACVGDRLCEMTMPHWDVSRVTDMSFLFQGMSQFNVDISQWEMSQVTTAAGMFEGAAGFYRDISGWTFADNANTTGMFTGADTWLAVKSRTDGFDSTAGPPGAWVFNPCLENERVENGLCAPCTGGGTRAAGDDPAAGDTGCAFPDRAALKAAVDNCIAVDPTGVACCSHGADCGAAGTVEMPDWDVSLVTSMSELVQWQGAVQRGYIAMGHLERHDHVQDVPRCRCVQPRYRCMGYLERHDHARDVLRRPTRSTSTYRDGTSARSRIWGTCSTTPTHSTPCRWAGTHPKSRILSIFLSADAWYARFTGGDGDTLPDAGGRARTTRATRPSRPSTATSATAPTPS